MSAMRTERQSCRKIARKEMEISKFFFNTKIVKNTTFSRHCHCRRLFFKLYFEVRGTIAKWKYLRSMHIAGHTYISYRTLLWCINTRVYRNVGNSFPSGRSKKNFNIELEFEEFYVFFIIFCTITTPNRNPTNWWKYNIAMSFIFSQNDFYLAC